MRNNNEDVNFSVLLYANLGALTTGILAGFSWILLVHSHVPMPPGGRGAVCNRTGLGDVSR